MTTGFERDVWIRRVRMIECTQRKRINIDRTSVNVDYWTFSLWVLGNDWLDTDVTVVRDPHAGRPRDSVDLAPAFLIVGTGCWCLDSAAHIE